jgi:hypothetical protein
MLPSAAHARRCRCATAPAPAGVAGVHAVVLLLLQQQHPGRRREQAAAPRPPLLRSTRGARSCCCCVCCWGCCCVSWQVQCRCHAAAGRGSTAGSRSSGSCAGRARTWPRPHNAGAAARWRRWPWCMWGGQGLVVCVVAMVLVVAWCAHSWPRSPPPPPHVSHTPWGGVIGVSKKQLHVIGLPDCACAIQPLLTLSTPPHTRPRTRLDQPFHCCCLLPAWATPKPDRSPIKCVDGVTCVCIGAPAATTLGLGALLPECPFWALSALPEGLAGRPGARDCQQPAGARLPADCMRPRSTSSDHNDTTPPRPLCCGACAPPHSHPPPP